MSYKIIVSKTALETFDEITKQIKFRWGSKYVVDFEQRVNKVFNLISKSPLIYKSLSIDINVRKGFIHRNCSVYYEIEGETIIILFFWDNRQGPFI